MGFHVPTEAERDEVEDTAAVITASLLERDLGPGFAGAVLTVSMSHILAVMDDEMAEACLKMHGVNAMRLRGFLRKRLEGMRH